MRVSIQYTAECHNECRSREEKILRWFFQGFLLWFVVYIYSQEQNGFFAVTVDRVQSVWVQLIFLNIPLQLFLTIISGFGLTRGRFPTRTRLCLAVAMINAVSILGHIGISFFTA